MTPLTAQDLLWSAITCTQFILLLHTYWSVGFACFSKHYCSWVQVWWFMPCRMNMICRSWGVLTFSLLPMPWCSWASLSPIGFPSKDVILKLACSKDTIDENFFFWLGSVFVLFTSYYSFRSLFMIFAVLINSFGQDILLLFFHSVRHLVMLWCTHSNCHSFNTSRSLQSICSTFGQSVTRWPISQYYDEAVVAHLWPTRSYGVTIQLF